MTAGAQVAPGAWLRIIGPALLAALLAGCAATYPTTFGLTEGQIAERSAFVAVPAGQAWVNAPETVTVLQRNMGGETEQRIGLANHTAVRGDNMIYARTRLGPRGLRFEQVIAQAGGLPAPFTSARSGELMQDEDELGNYFWISETMGGDTTCVLALRRVENVSRPLPRGATAMDLLLRNCVHGSVPDALAPLLAGSISTMPIPRNSEGESRMISPLAAPSAGL